MIIFIILSCLILIISIIGSGNKNISYNANIFNLFLSFVLLVLLITHLNVFDNTPYRFNEKRINTTYIYKHKVYKINIDTIKTNEYIDSVYKLK